MTITDFTRRYEVQTANTRGRWEFALAFHNEADAFAAADRLSEDRRYVRVVDTQDNSEENN